MEFRRSFPAVTDAQVSAYEAANGMSIPQPYRKFLLRQNGGKPSKDRLIVPGWYGTSTCVSMFYGLSDDAEFDLARTAVNTDQYLPPSLFPIAEDSAGNLICLGIDSTNQGKVYFWNHEEELDEEGDVRQDYSNVYEVASSLEQFMNNLLPGD